MSKGRALVRLLFIVASLTSFSFAVTSDRITGDLTNGQKVQITGNVHGLARSENDLGRADGSRVMEHLLLSFRLSAAQQKDLNQFLAQLGDRSSKNFHKYLTPAQFAARFGMSQNDLNKVIAWLQSEGFNNIKVGHTGNEISFDGTVAQVESTFSLEMHQYLIDGQVYLANSGNPSMPAAIVNSVIGLHNLNGFAPKPRAKVRPNLTSYVSGSHFLTPDDFATIYDLTPLYSAGVTGGGQKIAIVGQSTVSTTDLAHFRTSAGLSPSTVIMTLVGGTAARCSGDEGESDLDLEWAGGVAKDASIIFLYAGLGTGDTCGGNRNNSVWNAIDEALTGAVAPFVSSSYGYCESGLGASFAGRVNGQPGTLEQWIQAGQALGVTLTSASGDAGAADCDSGTETSATRGLAVDSPAAIPETTGAGGNEFTGDAAGTVTGTPPNTTAGATQYWAASGTGSDVVSTALSYIPEEAWNDTTENLKATPPGGLAASGGGASIYFAKPSWQTGTGVPSDSKRDVPDISVGASADHDGYLVCSEDDSATSCSFGFRESSRGNFTVVGGTSAAAPTFSAILALVNQYLGNTPPTGLAPVNQTLYSLPGNQPDPFHDIVSGNNDVPCTTGTTNCPTGTTEYGFSAGVGYDQVTGLGSVDGYNLAQIWKRTPTTTTVSPSATSVNLGASVTFTATVSPSSATGNVNFYDNGSSTTLGSGTLSNGTATFTTTSLPYGSNSVTATYPGDSNSRRSMTATPAVVTTSTSFTLASNPSVTTLSVTQGQTTGALNLTVTSSTGFVVSSGTGQQTLLPVTYTCTGLPSESTCLFNGTANPNTITSSATSVTLTIQTTAPTARLERPLDRGSRIFYAVLLPGLLGIVLPAGSRKRTLSRMRMLGLFMVLGFSTLWMASCGGTSSSGNKNPGTPVGSSTVTVNATTSGGPSSSLRFTLSVSPAP